MLPTEWTARVGLRSLCTMIVFSCPSFKKVFLLGFFYFCLLVLGCSQYSPTSQSELAAHPAENTLVPFPLDPTLKLETGRHLGRINRVALDGNVKWLVTGSQDKTVRVWDIQRRVLAKTLRPPIGKKQEGEIRAVAISPKGDIIACAGWTGEAWEGAFSVYLFNRVTGLMEGKISSLPSTIEDLEISQDGKLLAVGLDGKNGVRVYRMSDLSLVMTDRGYLPFSSVYGIAFDHRNRMVTTSYDGFIRLYSEDFQVLAKYPAPDGKRPYAVAFSPDGRSIAVGYEDSDIISLLSGTTLKPEIHQPSYAPVSQGCFSAVSWSKNGKYLYAGGTARDGGRHILRIWGQAGTGPFLDSFPTNNSILDLAPVSQTGMVFSDANGQWGFVQHTGNSSFRSPKPVLDFRDANDHLWLSNDAAVLQLTAPKENENTFGFNVSQRVLFMNTLVEGLHAPRVHASNLQVENWKNLLAPVLNGKQLALDPHEVSRSFCITSDQRRVVLGSSWALRLFDLQGNVIWKVSVPGDVWAVNASMDGRVVVAALGDGTIRWFRLKDGKEVLSLFVYQELEEYRWIVWSPSGYYDAAPGGEHLLIWNKNYGPKQAADAFPVSHFRAVSYRPDVIAKMLETWDERMAVRLANVQKNQVSTPNPLSSVQQNLLARQFQQFEEVAKSENGKDSSTVDKSVQSLPPQIVVVSPRMPVKTSEANIRVVFSVWTPPGTSLQTLRAFLDETAVSSLRDIPVVGKTSDGWPLYELRIPLQQKNALLSIVVTHQGGMTTSKNIPIEWESKGDFKEFQIKPNLYVLAVGTSQFREKRMPLPFAVADAQWMASVFQNLKGTLFGQVEAKVLLDDQVSQQSLLRELDWLDHVTTENDVAVMFFEGHAVVNEAGHSFYLPYDGDLEHLKRTALPFSVIGNTLRSLSGKKIVFADVCHQNTPVGVVGCNSAIQYLVKDGVSAGEKSLVVFSTSGHERTISSSGWTNGALILALQQELKGKDGLSNVIWAGELETILQTKMRTLTRGYQSPAVLQSSQFQDFPFLTFGDSGNIPKVITQLADSQFADSSPVSVELEKLPPVITITSPEDYQSITTSNVLLRYSIRSPSSEPIIDLKVLLDGKPLPNFRGLQVGLKGKPQGTHHELKLKIPQRDVAITLLAKTQWATSEPTMIHLLWAGETPSTEKPIKPNLYAIAVGISQYEDPSLNLEFAGKDALEFLTLLRRQKGGLYKNVFLKTITDIDAKKGSILGAFEWLERSSTTHDVAIIFLAGHGVNDKGGVYYFLPHEADTERLRQTGIAFSDIQETLSSIKGKTLLFVDTCHAGNIMGVRRGVPDINVFINELTRAENGTVVFASSTGRQYSQERKEWENGAFTEALLEGISGKADILHEGVITINMLRYFLSKRVKELTGGEQTPTTISPHTISDFPFILVPNA